MCRIFRYSEKNHKIQIDEICNIKNIARLCAIFRILQEYSLYQENRS